MLSGISSRVLALGAAAGLILGWPIATRLLAADHGRMGETFPILETDMLAVIETRLKSLEASGKLAALNQDMRARAEASVRRPPIVKGLATAERPRRWLFDPAITLAEDIADHQGKLVARAGTRVNPLDFVELRQALVFIDGRDPAQIDWAVKQYRPEEAKIIFVAGSPFEAMKPYARRFWFDQGGQLVRRFGIEAVPALAQAAGDKLQLSEIPLEGKRPS